MAKKVMLFSRKLQNPIQVLGANQTLVERYLKRVEVKDDKSVEPLYKLDLEKFIEAMNKLAILQMGQFHPDRNPGDPTAEEVFKTDSGTLELVQSSPEAVQAYANEFLAQPAHVVTQIRQEANKAISAHEEKQQFLKETIIRLLVQSASGDNNWAPSLPNNRRFLMRRFGLESILNKGRIGLDLLTKSPADTLKPEDVREFHVTNNGTLQMFTVTSGKDIVEENMERHRPKKEQLIVQEKFVFSSGTSQQEQGFYVSFLRDALEKLSGVRIIGSINPQQSPNDIPRLNELHSSFDQTFGTNTHDALTDTLTDTLTDASGLNNKLKLLEYSGQIDRVTPIKNAYRTVYSDGVTIEEFAELADFIKPDIEEGLVFACKETDVGTRIFLLGENIPLHQKTPDLKPAAKNK